MNRIETPELLSRMVFICIESGDEIALDAFIFEDSLYQIFFEDEED